MVALAGRAPSEATALALTTACFGARRAGGSVAVGGAAGRFPDSAVDDATRRCTVACIESGDNPGALIGATVAGVATRWAATVGRGGVGAGDDAGLGRSGGAFKTAGAGGGDGATDCASATGTTIAVTATIAK
jgi:hypothetical protein